MTSQLLKTTLFIFLGLATQATAQELLQLNITDFRQAMNDLKNNLTILNNAILLNTVVKSGRLWSPDADRLQDDIILALGALNGLVYPYNSDPEDYVKNNAPLLFLRVVTDLINGCKAHFFICTAAQVANLKALLAKVTPPQTAN